jgi:spermidine synthase
MAIVWSQTIEENHYEVRTAGATMRLYRNGVTHSQWNPNRPLSGCIWDLIALPALYRAQGDIENVLMLGFGAGAVANKLRALIDPGKIVGIDMDPIHLSIADGFFECADGCELVAADAVEWAQSDTGSHAFDLIIDDLYSEENEIPVRCAPLDLDWFNTLSSLLRPGGMLVLNSVEPEKVPHLAPLKNAKLKERFPHVKVFRMQGYENRIVAFSEQELSDSCFQLHLRRIYKAYPRCSGVAKRYISFQPGEE